MKLITILCLLWVKLYAPIKMVADFPNRVINQVVKQCDRKVMWRIINMESENNQHAVSSTGDYGLCQINLSWHPEVNADSIFDVRYNITQAYRILLENRANGRKDEDCFYGLRRKA